MLTREDPLWMPQGSVRAIIALMIVATFCYLAVKGVIPIDAFMNAVLLLLGFYFMQKRENGGSGR